MSTTSLMTFAEFEQLSDLDAGKRELVEGEVITMPPPFAEHSDLALVIQHFLSGRVDWKRVRPDGTGYLIGDNWLVPDVSVLWPDQRREKYYLGAPMIAVEILSTNEEIESRLTIYFRGGAQEVWVIDPRRRAFTAYERRGDADEVIRRVIASEHHSAALGFTISLADIFGAQTL